MTVAAGTTENGGDGARVRRASETERGGVELGGAGASERGGKWERWVEAEASGRPYPLPASAPARWLGGSTSLLRSETEEQGGGGERPLRGGTGLARVG